jgi:hypothetical protein
MFTEELRALLREGWRSQSQGARAEYGRRQSSPWPSPRSQQPVANMEPNQLPAGSSSAQLSRVEPRITEQEFLFVNSAPPRRASEPKAYKGHRDVRSFLMQKARRARPWSTSKQSTPGGGKRTPSRKRSRDSLSSSSDRTPKSHSATDQILMDMDIDDKLAETGESSLVAARQIPNSCELCGAANTSMEHRATCFQQLLEQNASILLPQSSIDGHFDPFGTLPVQYTASTKELWDHCEQNPHKTHIFAAKLCSSFYLDFSQRNSIGHPSSIQCDEDHMVFCCAEKSRFHA